MKTTGYLLLLGIVCTTPSYSQTTPERDPDACTSIMVGKNATTDGSVITSHTCDSWYRTWVNVVPAKDYESTATTSIYDGRMHTEFVNDQTKLTVKGEIPQVAHIFFP